MKTAPVDIGCVFAYARVTVNGKDRENSRKGNLPVFPPDRSGRSDYGAKTELQLNVCFVLFFVFFAGAEGGSDSLLELDVNLQLSCAS